MRDLGGWQTTGLYKGKFGIKGFFEYLDFSIRTWFEGVKVEKQISSVVIKSETTKTVNQFSTISFENARKIIKKSRRNMWRFVISVRVILDLIWNIPWKKIGKLLILIIFIPAAVALSFSLYTLVTVTTDGLEKKIITIIDNQSKYIDEKVAKQKEYFDDMMEKEKRYVDDSYNSEHARWSALSDRVSELEGKKFVFEHTPNRAQYGAPKTATIMSGKYKGATIELK